MKQILAVYLLLINLTGFFCFFSDIRRARNHAFRISEKTLFLTALLGGGAGCLVSMYLFRHKTRHLRFVLGIPLLTVLWIWICLRIFPLL